MAGPGSRLKREARAQALTRFESDKFKRGLRRHVEVHRRMVSELEEFGFEFPAFCEEPMETLEQITIMQMAKLLLEKAPSMQQLKAVEVAYKIYPLAALAQMRTQSKAVNEFREKYTKKEDQPAIEAEVVDEPSAG